MAAREPFNVTARSSSPAVTTQRSPWHSPVPYLFGGLAAMLGLIAFALLILACSYWKLSGYLENSENNDGDRDLEAGEGGKGGDDDQKPVVYEDKILVIMAGDAKPTFLATPISSSRSSSFGDNTTTCSCNKTDVEMAEQTTDVTTSVKLETSSTAATAASAAENVHHHQTTADGERTTVEAAASTDQTN